MSSGALSPWAFFKSTFYKFCFGLGLATLSYYSFAGVKAWIDERHASGGEKIREGGLQEKINALTEGGSGTESAVQMSQFPLSLPADSMLPSSASALPRAPQGDASVLPASPEGSPAAVPGASPDPALAATAESAPNPEGGEVVPNGAMDVPMPYAIPYVFDPGFPGPESGENAEEGGRKSESTSGSASSLAGSGTESAQGSFQGAAFPGVLNPSFVGGQNPQGSSSASSRITPQDLRLLTAGGLRATFKSENKGVTTATGTATVSTSRWTPDEGLRSEVQFSISGASAETLTFQIGVNLHKPDGTDALHTGAGSAIASSVRNEYRGGKLFRVFDFRLSKIKIRNEDLQQVLVTLSFEAGSGASPGVGPDSVISFVRTGVRMVQTPWNFNVPSANTDPVVTAERVNYSLPIERLP